MKKFLLLAALAAAWPVLPAQADEDGEDEAMAIAQRYGMDQLDRVEALRFTFNVKRGTTTVNRAWTWERAEGRVSVVTVEGGKKVSHAYAPARLNDGDAALNEKTDRWFVNDRYWLLFPHHLANDRGMEVTFDENEALPIPPGTADRLTIDYADNVGYTPGDTYEVYYGGDHLIRQWVFRKAGAEQPSLVATWDAHVRLGPLLVATRHASADGSFQIWFSDLAARLEGSSAWVAAVPAN